MTKNCIFGNFNITTYKKQTFSYNKDHNTVKGPDYNYFFYICDKKKYKYGY